MKKRKTLTLFASVLVAGGILAGCSSATEELSTDDATKKEETAPKEDEKTADKVEETVAVEDSITGKQISTYKEMMTEVGKAKEGKPVDWEAVAENYETNLQSAVTEISGEYDQAIQAAIEAGKTGELEPNIARQLVDKTTQSYFYQKQKRLHKDVVAALESGDNEGAELAFSEIKYVANEVLIPTAVKRDGYYELEGEASIEQNIKAGLSAQEEALKTGNIDDFKVYVQLTDKSVYKSYYLAANSYAKKIEAAVNEGTEDELELQIQQVEAWGFYQAIKGSLSSGDEEAAQDLDEIFSLSTTPVAEINAAEVSSLFTKAFVGKIKGYHEKAPGALDEGDVTAARVNVLEGNMFLKAIELELIDRLGEEKAKEAFTHAQQWYNAIEGNNKEEAATHSEFVVSALDEITN